MEIHDSTFESNTATGGSPVGSFLNRSQKFPELSLLKFPAGGMELSSNGHRSFDMLVLGSNKKDNVSLLFSFHLNYFSVSSEHGKNYLNVLLQFPAGHMERPLIGCCTPNSASVLTKLA
jgi:hypothetical protein